VASLFDKRFIVEFPCQLAWAACIFGVGRQMAQSEAWSPFYARQPIDRRVGSLSQSRLAGSRPPETSCNQLYVLRFQRSYPAR
jgi:hypothetical protein